jgi:inosine/xanthosine triphosphatase
MNVVVGSQNENKIQGVRDAFLHYYKPEDLTVRSAAIDVEEFGHPKNVKETVQGAVRRAKAAFGDCDLAVGIESGLLEAPYTLTGYFEGSICALYDGSRYFYGLAPGFEWPTDVIKGIVEKGLDGSQAMRDAGITDHEKIGVGEGAISLLTKGVVDRRKQIELSVIMALSAFHHPNHYS